MNLKHGSVIGGVVLSLVFMATVQTQAQGNGKNEQSLATTTLNYDYDWGGLSTLRTYVVSLVTQIEQSKLKVAQLEVALQNEINARQAADTALQNAINGISGGLTQAALDAAIASETAARSAAVAAEANARAAGDAALEGQIATEAAARETLATTVASFSSLTPLVPLATYMSVDTETIDGLAGPHVIFTGVNLHVRSGAGESFAANGRGNLIVGYNEAWDPSLPERDGSHNLVIGPSHRYNFGVGMVVGNGNRLSDYGASVTGGALNEAGMMSHVAGGRGNIATGWYSSVSGGDSNTASGNTAVVSAGQMNTASGTTSAVSGGRNNNATATSSTVGGGANTTNATANSFVP
jgi:hypothetical protein